MIYKTESLTGLGNTPERLAHAHPQAGTDETDGPPDAGRPSENEAGPGEEAQPTRKKRPGGNIFAVCPHTFAKVLGLGIKPALAFLTLACGTGGDNRTTRWGAEAIERRGLMGRRSAYNALRTLEEAGLISVRDKRNLRTLAPHLCKEKAELLWLPNRIIGAAPGDRSPLKPLSEMEPESAVKALALLAEIYRLNHLIVDHGVNPSLISMRASLQNLRQERGSHRIFGWSPKSYWHYMPSPSPLPLPERKEAALLLNILAGLHLIRVVSYAFTNTPERSGELLFPVGPRFGEKAEREYASLHQEAARRALERTARDKNAKEKLHNGFPGFVAVCRHIPAPLVIGLVRPRWLADTSHCRQWLATIAKTWDAFAQRDAADIHAA